MDTVKKELAIPIPAIIGQKAWREERTANISAAVKSLVAAINEARDKQNEGVRTSVNKTYPYYIQNLNRLINENKSLEAENDVLKEENAIVKERISQLDENAVRRVAAEKDKVIGTLKGQLSTTRTELTNFGNDYNAILSKYKYLVLQWNEMKQQPEIIEAMLRVEKRKQEEAATKREGQAKQSRRQSIIDRFVNKGHDALKSFSKTERIDFNEKEANAIYYGIMATTSKHHLHLDSAKRVEAATGKFLAGMTWDNCSDFRKNASLIGQSSLPQRESFIPKPFAKTSLHSSTTCRAVPARTFPLAVQTDVPTNLRIGMVHRKSDWEHRLKGKFMANHDKLCGLRDG